MSDDKADRVWNRRLFLQMGLATGVLAGIENTEAAESVGTVSEVRGVASAEQANQSRKLKERSPVVIGDTLVTAKSSRLKAALGGKTKLNMGELTNVKIDNFIVNAGGELSLGSGALILDAPSGAFPDGLSVESPFALIAVRGTRFFAGKIDSGFSVFVAKGEVNVRAGGRTVRLRTGEGTDIARIGEAPSAAKAWGRPKIRKALALVR